MSKVAITVIIPAYNCQEQITKALTSVLSQSYKAREIIVVDDGSSDDIKQTLSLYENQIRYIRKTNGGAASARNHGVLHSSSEWIAFLDADDIWHKDKLKTQASILEGKSAEDIAIICSEYRFINSIDQNELNSLSVDSSYNKISTEQLLHRPYLATPTVILSKQLFNNVDGYNENLHTAEDLDLYIRLALLGDIIKVNSELTHCLVSATSLTSKHDTYDNEIALYQSYRSQASYQPYLATINKHIENCQIDKLKYLIFTRQPEPFYRFLKTIKTKVPMTIKYKLLLKYYFLRFFH